VVDSRNKSVFAKQDSNDICKITVENDSTILGPCNFEGKIINILTLLLHSLMGIWCLNEPSNFCLFSSIVNSIAICYAFPELCLVGLQEAPLTLLF
jgi:hypothetical protein